jgi:hypothetical protein
MRFFITGGNRPAPAEIQVSLNYFLMKKYTILLTVFITLIFSDKLLSQSETGNLKLGIRSGASTCINGYNPSDDNIMAFYFTSYLRIKKHEFNLGMVYPVTTYGGMDGVLNSNIDPVVGYKYYFLKFPKWVNPFIHYEFQYLRYSGVVDDGSKEHNQYTETDNLFYNIIGFGFNGFFYKNQNFGFSWSLGFIIPVKKFYAGYQNYLNSNLSFYFTLVSFKHALRDTRHE